MILAGYATFEEMHGRKSTLPELIDRLKPFSRESVLYICAATGMILKLWQRGGWDHTNYDLLIASAFESLRGDWYRLSARSNDPELVFHRRQLLLLMKLAIEHCPENGADLLKVAPGFFGTILLMANDHFHYGLYPFDEKNGVDEKEKVSRVLAEFVPVSEYSGFRVENKVTRSHLMMTRHTQPLVGHQDFIDVAAEYEKLTGVSLADHEALTFGLFARCGNVTLADLQQNAWVAAVRLENFHATAVPKQTIEAFVAELAAAPAEIIELIKSARQKNRDFGANDFTVFRKRPLVNERYGSLPTDVLLVMEKFESGPYWRVNDIDKQTGDRLRRFWGVVFEAYVNEIIADASRSKSLFVVNPRLRSDPSIQVCDALLVDGDAIVLLEYKSSMFSARAKYGGDHVLLCDEITNKLVRDSDEKKRKGVEQLAEAVKLLFTDPTEQVVENLDLRGIRRVYPLLITLDDIGGSLLISHFLNFYFEPDVSRYAKSLEIRPLFCTDIESLEMVLPYSDVKPLSEFLQYWLEKDQNLIATMLAFFPGGLPKRRNAYLDKEWKALYQGISARLFPKQFAEAKQREERRLQT